MNKLMGLLLVLTLWPMAVVAPTNSPSLEMAMIQNNSLITISEPGYQNPGEIQKEEAINKVLAIIIQRESGGNPAICNQKFGCKAGAGLTQLIPTTIQYCEKKLGKSIDPFDADDNLDCARWLLENEGIKHWSKWSGPYDFR